MKLRKQCQNTAHYYSKVEGSLGQSSAHSSFKEIWFLGITCTYLMNLLIESHCFPSVSRCSFSILVVQLCWRLLQMCTTWIEACMQSRLSFAHNRRISEGGGLILYDLSATVLGATLSIKPEVPLQDFSILWLSLIKTRQNAQYFCQVNGL